MSSLLILGIVWSVMGIFGLFGIRRIPEQYKNRSWTKSYKRYRGLMDLIIGLLCVLMHVIFLFYPDMPLSYSLLMLFELCFPYVVLATKLDRKYRDRLKEEDGDSPEQR